MTNATDNPSIQIFLHCAWPASVPLSADIVEKLGPYLTRYAQTLKAKVHAVGANKPGDTLHLLVQLPEELSVKTMTSQLQAPSARYASTMLGAVGLTWRGASVASISASDLDWWQEQITLGDAPEIDAESHDDKAAEDEVPDWLREVLGQSPKK